jgi:hypothetical protein
MALSQARQGGITHKWKNPASSRVTIPSISFVAQALLPVRLCAEILSCKQKWFTF